MLSMKRNLFLLLASLLLSACHEKIKDIPEEVLGLAPIYSSSDWQDIYSELPQTIRKINKVYAEDSLLLVSETARGIHLIDNSEPAQPEPIAFIRILGNSDITLQGNVLYANNLRDLVVLDLEDPQNVRVLSRVPGAFPDYGSPIPEDYVGFFECPDPAFGSVIGWKEELLQSPQCWR